MSRLSKFFMRAICVALMLLAMPRAARAAMFVVPCTVPDLVEAIRAANLTPGSDTLELAGNCAYTLMIAQDNTGNGLPIITGEISINGNVAVIERSLVGGVASFRLFQIGAGGKLELNNLTLRNGNRRGANIVCPANCGGAIFNQGIVQIQNSTFLNNASSGGGAIYNAGTAEIVNSTLTGNTAITGGAILNAGAAFAITHATIASNKAEFEGGGVANTNGRVLFRNTLIANNENGNCAGALVNAGYNLDSGATCKFGAQNNSLSNTDPLLGALTDNGGFTNTIMLGGDSPALGRIPGEQGCTVGVFKDQRGATRPKPSGAFCDLGAIEVPEAETWFLIGSGIGGLATWLHWKWRRRAN